MEKASVHRKKKIKHTKKLTPKKEVDNKACEADSMIDEEDAITQDDIPSGEVNEDTINAIFMQLEKVKKAKKAQNQQKEETIKKEKGRRYTKDGFPIYTEDELEMNNPKAGTTPLCPFDCDCCH